MTPLYTTETQAIADVEALCLVAEVGAAPALVLELVRHVVRNPRAGSDALFITADAVRELAIELAPSPTHRALARLADRLAALAPARANPLEV